MLNLSPLMHELLQRRTHAFEAARSLASSRLDVDGMGDLSLGSGGQFSDANSSDGEGDQRMDSPAPPPVASPSHSHKTPRRKAKYQPWARNLLTQGETLDLSHGLPKGLESDWMLKVVPKGKRCLCAVGTDSCERSVLARCWLFELSEPDFALPQTAQTQSFTRGSLGELLIALLLSPPWLSAVLTPLAEACVRFPSPAAIMQASS